MRRNRRLTYCGLVFAALLMAAAAIITGCGAAQDGETTAGTAAAPGESEASGTQQSEKPFQQMSVSIEVNGEKTGSSDTIENTGVANPVVEATAGDIQDQLGISIDTDLIDKDAEVYIINKNMAHITWTRINVNGDTVYFTLRATKNADTAPHMHGIYGESKEGRLKTEVTLDGNKTLDLYFEEIGSYSIYTWQNGDIYYALVYDKPMSQMAMAEVLDSVMAAVHI